MPRNNGSTSARLVPKPGHLLIRMYRQGLGDCFLLAFGGAKPKDVRYLLIDCGVHSRQDQGTARLMQVMEDILAATGGHLHVVAATHEHADHLSGFVQKNSPFLQGKFTIGQLWVGWTEKVGDRQADTLRRKRGTARRIIAKAVQQAKDRNAPALALRVDQTNDFNQPSDDSLNVDELTTALRKMKREHPGALDKLQDWLRKFTQARASANLGVEGAEREKPSSNELALGLLASLADEVKYGMPGESLAVEGVAAMRALVLGPPRNDAFLKRDQPTKLPDGDQGDGKYNEVYLSGSGALQSFELAPALGVDDQITYRSEAGRYPFDYAYRRPIDWQAHDIQAKGVPADTRAFFASKYFADRTAFRRIDNDWLGSAEKLALNLDSDTNNTSLVLALEWGPAGKGAVLLFPGDAQVGNWLSWRQALATPDAVDDLLRRTLIYKVGHHGSHNATVRRDPGQKDATHPLGVPFGLELMDDIIALVPVDRDAAQRKMPIKWDMPYPALYRRLREKARNRVLRSDDKADPLKPNEGPDQRPTTTQWRAVPGTKQVQWRKAETDFQAGLQSPLYFDLLIAPWVEA